MLFSKFFIITALQEGGEREKERREEGMNKEKKKRIREHS